MISVVQNQQPIYPESIEKERSKISDLAKERLPQAPPQKPHKIVRILTAVAHAIKKLVAKIVSFVKSLFSTEKTPSKPPQQPKIETETLQSQTQRSTIEKASQLSLPEVFRLEQQDKYVECRKELRALRQEKLKEALKKTKTKPLGISNIGNSCYMNSTVQALFTIADQLKVDGDLIERNPMRDAFLELYYTSLVENDPEKLKPAAEKLRDTLFDNADQQDAGEAMLHILNDLPFNFGLKESKIAGDYILPRLTSTSMLVMPIVTDNLSQIIKAFSRQEAGDPDNKWRDLDKWTEETHLTEFPQTLIVSLKRFNNDGEKISTEVNFGETVAFRELIDPNLLHNGEKVNYRVKAFVQHCGDSPKGGHYVAYVRKGDKWFCCNDSETRAVKSPPLGEAYILIFEKG